ncbi:divalent-cation tolerance protein CutA [Ponticaulis sp.]|uniref:divalent-cation tolerance protein CutA n=1 Tax=Ponticaulis sp. TaxID=2020902 RepID=UPI000B6F23C3|nr:divalent-cation tolerance protein CutA [Ponticaulis sp.]MAI91647.1 divalent-cation tolerance protein CutA [Ponticaulis sp.]OUX97213.1 MAG: hypothetical protein CBB65_14495 [Hyphomonadaceae bacterium TMED5]|tara:strand:- start:42461 stop:42784 length:324 start_codon:yes stop_codon:yes gene_type:complete
MTELLLIRVNCPTQELAYRLAEATVDGRLAACANIEGPIRTIYRWEGKLARDEEYVLWLKATEELWPDLETLIIALHPADTPAILAFPIANAPEKFAKWVKGEVSVS